MVDRGRADTLVAEHALAHPNDPFLQDRPTTFVFSGDEVYGTAEAPFHDGRIQALIADCETTDGLVFALLRRGPDARRLRHGDVLRPADLEQLAEVAVLVGIDVFDGESYLFALLDEDARKTALVSD